MVPLKLMSPAAGVSLLLLAGVSAQNPQPLPGVMTPTGTTATTPAGVTTPTTTNYGPNAKCFWGPKAALTNFGNSNNVIPFTWTPIHYQQVFNAGTFAASFVSNSLGLRQDEAFSNRTGVTIDLEVALSATKYDAATITTTFATNVTGPATTVINRKKVVLPNTGAAPTLPDTVLVSFPFDRPFIIDASKNLLVDVEQRGNSNNNSIVSYPLDAFNGDTTTSRVYGTTASGSVGRNFGLAMCFGEGSCPAARYQYFGQGCPGSAPSRGCNWLPSAQAAAFGNSNNNIPFSWTPIRYQQVFDASNITASFVGTCLGLRQDQSFGNRSGQTIDLEVALSATKYTAATLTSTFATNHTSARTTVINRKKVVLPNMGAAPTNPDTVLIAIPFDAPFLIQANANLLVDIEQRGNSNNNASFTYPLDATSGNTTTSRLFGTTATGTIGRSYGLVMCFCPGSIPLLSATSLPKLGGGLTVEISSAKPTALCLLMHAISAINLDLTKAGMPGCSLYVNNNFHVQAAVANAAGKATFGAFPIPNNVLFCGVQFYQQGIVVDPGTNALGLVLTRRGIPTVGS